MFWIDGAYYRDYLRDKGEAGIFISLWPAENRGNGKIRENNINTGYAQGNGSLKRKVSCKQCGFIFDLNKVDHSGGSLDGNGAGGAVAGGTVTATSNWGDTVTDYNLDKDFRKAGGCPLCFSKNGTTKSITKTLGQEPRFSVGF